VSTNKGLSLYDPLDGESQNQTILFDMVSPRFYNCQTAAHVLGYRTNVSDVRPAFEQNRIPFDTTDKHATIRSGLTIFAIWHLPTGPIMLLAFGHKQFEYRAGLYLNRFFFAAIITVSTPFTGGDIRLDRPNWLVIKKKPRF